MVDLGQPYSLDLVCGLPIFRLGLIDKVLAPASVKERPVPQWQRQKAKGKVERINPNCQRKDCRSIRRSFCLGARRSRHVSNVPQPDSCTAPMTKRCPHSGRPAAYKALGGSQSFGPEPRGRVSGRRLPCRGFNQGQLLLCPAMNADLLSDRSRQSSQISISVPNSTTCLAGTPKKVAEPLALCCRNAKRVSRHTAMPTISSLGMIVSRPT